MGQDVSELSIYRDRGQSRTRTPGRFCPSGRRGNPVELNYCNVLYLVPGTVLNASLCVISGAWHRFERLDALG